MAMLENDPFELPDDPEIEDLDPQDENLPDEQEPAEDQRQAVETESLRREIEDIRREQESRRAVEQQAAIEAEWSARVEALKAREAEVSKQWEQALDSDDTAALRKANEDLIDLKFQRLAAEQAKSQSHQVQKEPEDQAGPAARAWLALNPEFQTDEAFRTRVMAANEALVKAGKDPTKPAFYRELDAALNGRERKQHSGYVAGVSRGAGGMSPGAKRPASQTRLSGEDLQKLKGWKLDPNNPEHRRAWAMRNAPLQ